MTGWPKGRPRIHPTVRARRQAEYRRERARELGVPLEELPPTRPYRRETT